MYEMKSQKTWNFAGQKLTAHKILETASVEQMRAGNWEIIPNMKHLDSTIIIPTDNGNIVVDADGRGKILLETSPMAYKKLMELKSELDDRWAADEKAMYDSMP